MPNIPLYKQKAQTGFRYERVIRLNTSDCSGNNSTFSEIQKIVGCHHFNNFNSTAKMTWQVILVLLENGEGEKGANKIYVTFQNCKFKT